ncbi:SDR family oxidoreductase [bacterium]|nr:SDR family oxidoreductase [bacterium]
MNLDFSNTVSVIFGGTSGIGFQVAQDISALGGKLIIVSKDEQKLIKVAHQFRNCDYIAADISQYSNCVRISDEIHHSFNKLDFLVFSAGVFYPASFEKTTEKIWEETINTNLKSSFFLIKSLLPLIKTGKGKSIVLLSSILASFGTPNVSVYSISKSGIIALTKSLSIELAEHKIRVNCVSPSYVRTPMTEPLINDSVKYSEIISRHPMGRIGTTNDVSNLVLFLLSDSSNWMTGQNLVIDGGRSTRI